jgi:hypothetical protein
MVIFYILRYTRMDSPLHREHLVTLAAVNAQGPENDSKPWGHDLEEGE